VYTGLAALADVATKFRSEVDNARLEARILRKGVTDSWESEVIAVEQVLRHATFKRTLYKQQGRDRLTRVGGHRSQAGVGERAARAVGCG
jgi:hypothetical protein